MAKRIPPEVLEYLRKMGQAFGSHGSEEHDGCGTIGPREEGIQRSSPEAHRGPLGQEARREEKVTLRCGMSGVAL